MVVEQTIYNPYWDELVAQNIVAKLPQDSYISLDERNDFCRRYSWAIPDPDSLAFVAEWLSPQAVEIGCGTGLWASLLSQMGVGMLAYDRQPPQLCTDNLYHSPFVFVKKSREYTEEIREVFFPVKQGIPSTLLKVGRKRNLFLCWPPYSNDMAEMCLEYYKGNRLVYIGESSSGCTGTSEFFDLLREEWHEVAEHSILQWPAIHDYITVFERGKEHASSSEG